MLRPTKSIASTREKGIVNERSIELGETEIVFSNIGSFTIQEDRKNSAPIVLGSIFSLIGILIASSTNGIVGVVVLLAGIGAILWGLTRKPDIFLLIGTCDGRQTNIVSKNREFLKNVRQFLRNKIDDKMLTARIDIGTAHIEVGHGAVAIGPGAIAAGAYGTINNTVASNEK